jgi:hypothetical protein
VISWIDVKNEDFNVKNDRKAASLFSKILPEFIEGV